MSNVEPTPIEEYVHRAVEGDEEALARVVSSVSDLVYNLAIRMLALRADAEEASQEILIRVVTKLSTFRGDSKFTTWVYRIATNYLLRARKRKTEEMATFDNVGSGLGQPPNEIEPATAAAADTELLVIESYVGCTTAMMMCLDRPHRLAFILGAVLDLPGPECAEVLEIDAATFRKRLSRSRQKIQAFMDDKCGVMNPDNPCRCRFQVNRIVGMGFLDPTDLQYAAHPASRGFERLAVPVMEIHGIQDAAAALRSHPIYRADEVFVGRLRELLAGPQTILQ